MSLLAAKDIINISDRVTAMLLVLQKNIDKFEGNEGFNEDVCKAFMGYVIYYIVSLNKPKNATKVLYRLCDRNVIPEAKKDFAGSVQEYYSRAKKASENAMAEGKGLKDMIYDQGKDFCESCGFEQSEANVAFFVEMFYDFMQFIRAL